MSRKARGLGVSNDVETFTLLDNEAEPPTALDAGARFATTVPQVAASLTGPTHGRELSSKAGLGRAPTHDETAPDGFPEPLRDPRRYRVLGEHGRGGLGRVSRAHDRELGRDVAIKELLSRDHVNEARFMREARITARLEHPGIVPVYEAGRWPDGTPFYAMKLVSGRALRDLIAERTTIEQRIGLLHHVIAVADAIAYAHGRNVIHRDLKPGNVIVGEFGETVVIDWGLAKDLLGPEESSLRGGPFRTNRADELTTVGTVLGTPAYMAPEQERGEQVDQRADVFAIGTMLWELCSMQRVPPATARLRHRILRRAGIDEDLATIIDKAIAPDPERRYRDAGALAADLKAFKSGARIAARSYSPFAMLIHWTRRHRAIAVSAVTAVLLALAGTLLYVRKVAVERDRADTSEASATRARAAAEASLDELTLKHAQLLLLTDPSAAIDALATYHGPDLARADQVRAEAMGRGVAVLRAQPHTEAVHWAEAVAGGAIISLSIDGTIARTALDGTSVVLARGVSKSRVSSYSSSRHLLAYACDPSDLCLFDVMRATPIPTAPALRGAHVVGAAFSPDGALLAMMSEDGVLRILDVTDPARPVARLTKRIDGGADVTFLDDSIAVAGTATSVEFVRMNGASERLSVPESTYWDTSASDHGVAIAITTGQALVLAGFPAHVVARAELCHGPFAGLRFIPGRRSIGYACRAGAVGIWDLQHGAVSVRAQLEGNADLLTVSPEGDYLVAAGGKGTVTVLDLNTDIITSYQGHGFRLTSLTPPTTRQPSLISADVHGAVRAWPLPARLARVATASSSPFYTAIFDRQSTSVTATTWRSVLTSVSPATGVRTVGPHEPYNPFLEPSGHGKSFATYGLHDAVEIWSSATMTRTHLIHTGQGSVSQLHFVGDSDEFITSGHDGRLVRWSASGQQTVLTQRDQPIDHFAPLPAIGAIVFSTVNGTLWRVDAGGQTHSIRMGGVRVNRILALPDQQTVYAGYASGDVIAIDTRSWQQTAILHGAGAAQELATTSDGRRLAVATSDGVIHVGARDDGAPLPGNATWVTLAAHARHIALAPDGLLVIACADGTIWLYSPQRHWLCLPTGAGDLALTRVSADGKTAVVLDVEGRLLWVDLEAARKQLGLASPPR